MKRTRISFEMVGQWTAICIIMASFLLTVGCGSSDNESQVSQAKPLDAPMVSLGGAPVSLAGITFTPPQDWRDLGSGGMRKADYTFGPIGDDTDSASVAVYYFGADYGGGVDANIQRWIGQMSMPDGSNPSEAAPRSTYSINGMTAHHVELTGIYNVSAGGPMMGGPVTPKDGYLMSAVVLEAPEGNVFFKLTGPEATARAMSEAFMSMLSQVETTDQSM